MSPVESLGLPFHYCGPVLLYSVLQGDPDLRSTSPGEGVIQESDGWVLGCVEIMLYPTKKMKMVYGKIPLLQENKSRNYQRKQVLALQILVGVGQNMNLEYTSVES